MSGGFDNLDGLVAEAKAALREQEDDPNTGLGDDMTPAPEAYFRGRWRGTGAMQTKRGLTGVYLVWDTDGKPGFLYQHARLVQQVDEQEPQIGDLVVVLRGEARAFERDGEARQTYPYVLRKRECSDPLPVSGEAGELEAQTGGGPDDDDLPF